MTSRENIRQLKHGAEKSIWTEKVRNRRTLKKNA
jgi:hypothetical protein